MPQRPRALLITTHIQYHGQVGLLDGAQDLRRNGWRVQMLANYGWSDYPDTLFQKLVCGLPRSKVGSHDVQIDENGSHRLLPGMNWRLCAHGRLLGQRQRIIYRCF